MNTNSQSPRPGLVTLAVILLVALIALGLTQMILGARSYDLHFYIQMSVMFLILAVVGWFIFRGKNWARWAFVGLFVLGVVIRFPQLIANIHNYSLLRVGRYLIGTIADLIIVLALFHPSASRWFRGRTNVT